MKKIFLVYGHYNEKSFNAAIRDIFIKTAKENGNEVDYVDSPLVNEVIQFLDLYQFQVFDIVDFRRREIDNHLWQCDMFFIKKDSFLLKEKRKDKDLRRKSNLKEEEEEDIFK